jgi:hypothetical protein
VASHKRLCRSQVRDLFIWADACCGGGKRSGSLLLMAAAAAAARLKYSQVKTEVCSACRDDMSLLSLQVESLLCLYLESSQSYYQDSVDPWIPGPGQ